MERRVMTLIVLFVCFLSYTSQSEGKIHNHIVAVINEEIITQTEFNRTLEFLKGGMLDAPSRNPDPNQWGEKALNALINERLQMQEAKKMGISVFPEEIEKSIQEIKEKNGIVSNWELEKALLSQNMSLKDLRAQIKKGLLLLKLRERAIRPKIDLTDAEITAHFTQYNEKEARGIHLSHILCVIPQDADDITIARVHDKALKIWEELQRGKDFAEAAKEYSQDPETSQQGGNLGYLSLEQMSLPFKKAIATLKVGQFSRPIQTPFGFHLIKLNDQQSPTPTLTKNSAQWNEIKETLVTQKIEKHYQQWLEELRKQAYIEIRAMEGRQNTKVNTDNITEPEK